MTVWGTAVADSTNAFRIGYDVSQSPTTVANGTASVVVTLTIKLQTKYFANDSGADWTISGDIVASGSTAFDHNSSTAWSNSNITTLAVRTKTVTTSFSGPVVTNGSATVTGLAAIAGTASVSWSITTAQRPVGVPAAPVMSGTTGATRVSDTQHNVAWTNTSPTSASNPYVNLVVQRSTDGGAYTSIATLGVVTSYSDKTTSANHRYAYRVYAKNGAGNSSVSAASNTLKTTPSAPGTPTAVKSGTDIVVSWSNPAWQADNIEVWHAANGVWDASALTTTLAATATSYTHTAPSTTVTHTYRLRSKTTTPALTSAYSAQSNVVQLQAPPSAPTNLAPAGIAADLSLATALTWKHNPVDTTAQTKFEVQHRAVGAPTWNSSGTITSGVSSYTLAAGTYANGQQVEWQVRTYGAHVTASPWSASAVITASAKPVVTITNPGASFNSSQLTAAWTYFDAEGTPQAQWTADLYVGNAALFADRLLEHRTGVGTATSVTFDTRIQDAVSNYRVEIRAQDGSGLWSDWDVQPFGVSYSLPEMPTLALQWNSANESVVIAIDNPPTTAGRVDTVSNDVYRSIDGGPWLLVASGVPPDGTVVDYLPSLSGINLYKAVAWSALPSSITSDIGDRPELIQNQSFETDASNWSPTLGTIAAAPLAQAMDGSNVLEYTSTSAATLDGNYVVSTAQPAIPGKVYVGSAYVQTPVGSTLPQMRLSIQWLNAANALVGTAAASADWTLVPGEEMRLLTVNGTAPAGATQARLQVQGIGQAMPVGSKFRVDVASLKESVQQSALPAIATPGSNSAVVNAGPGFAQAVKLTLDVVAQIKRNRAKELQEYDGRTLPVEYAGQQRSRTVDLSAKVNESFDGLVWDAIGDLSDLPAPACYRDPDGRRIFVSMGGPDGGGFGQRTQTVGWTLTEVGYAETVEST